jgi:hypothetical protein
MGRGTTTTRHGDLNLVFKNGDSPLLNQIAALCILFEDLETEIAALKSTEQVVDHARQQQRQFYYVRRSLITLYEFRGRLIDICRDPDFTRAEGGLSELNRESIKEARRFLTKNDVLRRYRNDFGAHITPEAIGKAIKYIGVGAFSSMSHRSSDDGFFLELPFANDLFRAAFASSLTTDASGLEEKMGNAFEKIIEGLQHAQNATFALLSGFIWDRFGY